MRLEYAGKHFCYKATLEDETTVYAVAKSLNAAAKRFELALAEKAVRIDYLGEAV